MAFVTMYAGYLNITTNYYPKKLYLLVALSIVIMSLCVVIFLATFRRWNQLLRESKSEPTPPKKMAAVAGD
jgi:carbon starvation protein